MGVVVVRKKKDSQTYSKAPLGCDGYRDQKPIFAKLHLFTLPHIDQGVVAYGYSHDEVRIRKDLKENFDKVSVLE